MARRSHFSFSLRRAGLLVGCIVAVGGCEAAPGGISDGPGEDQVVERTLVLTEGTNMAAAVSPDGERIALTLQGGLWLVPAEGGEAERLTGWEVEATSPSWSPDGSRIAFQSFEGHYYQVWTIGADGSGASPVTSGHFDHREPAWSPDGSRIAFSSDRAGEGAYDIWTVDAGGEEDYRRWTRSDADEHSPAWSPEGSRIAYVSGSAVRAVGEEGSPEEIGRTASGAARAPAWRPDGRGVVFQDGSRRIVDGEGALTDESEDVFPFPVSWFPDGRFAYTADGQVKTRGDGGEEPREIAFRAELTVERPVAGRKEHRFDDPAPRPVHGIFSPVVSPDGDRIAFVALGDLWVLRIGGTPERLTDDGPYITWSVSWDPGGDRIHFSSDRHGDGRPDLYAIDLDTREIERIATTPDSRMVFPTLSPDGERFAYIDGGDQSLRVHEIASGESRVVAEQAYASNVGRPSWSPDGRTIALADIERANTRFREGRNLIRTVDVESGEWRFHEPGPLPSQLSERFEAGPVWSPDGARMAFVMSSTLHVIPVDSRGAPTGPATRVSDRIAAKPAWTPDSGSLLYLSDGRLRMVRADGTDDREIPVGLEWAPAVPDGRVHVHAGALWDGMEPSIRRDVVIRIEGGRIAEVGPAGDDPRVEAERAGARFIDASELTAMPGLWDAHVHPRVQDFTGQWWAVQLAYGITTVLSNGVSTYHTLLARESLETGRWVGPRLLTSPIYDGGRPFYGHHRSVADEAALALELESARVLGMDYLKAYVRAPVSYMRAVADAAQEMGVPNGSHFLSPGIQSRMGGTTHLSASQRMGYSWAESPGGRSYQDVIELYTRGDFHLSSHHVRGNNILGDDPAILDDPRFLELMPAMYVDQVAAQAARPPTGQQREATRRDVATPARILSEGGLVTIGSDTPLAWPALGLHAQLRALAYSVGNHEALQTVTINAARYAYADHELGSVEPGKIADIVLVRGDPLDDVGNAANVEQVIRAGRSWTVPDILAPYR